MNDDHLRRELREALDSRTPDRTAMLNRIAANRAADTRPRGRIVRLAGSALAVVTVLGIGGVAKWALADDSNPTPAAPAPIVTPATPSPSEVASTSSPTSRPVTSRPRSEAPVTTPPSSAPAPSASLVRGHPGDTQAEKGSLWSDGSIAAGGRSEVTLKAGADLTELDLTFRVPLTAGLAADGYAVPNDTVTATVTKESGALLYRFRLEQGATMPAGTYLFAAKYTAASRDATEDTYEAYATSVERKRIHIYGNFAPTD
jgi:hypothetical protein